MLQFDAAEIFFVSNLLQQLTDTSVGIQTHSKRFIQWIWIYRKRDVEWTIFVYDIVICYHLQNFSNFFHAYASLC